jgi:hypothetical protein
VHHHPTCGLLYESGNESVTLSGNESGCGPDDDGLERPSAFENETCSEIESDGEENAAKESDYVVKRRL